jgi:hypothetical protein
VLAQQPARQKGPIVWLDMDQAELDVAYDQCVYAPNLQQISKRIATNSDAARARLATPERHAYRSTPIEALDVYRTGRANAPIHIHIHGGEWRLGTAQRSAFPAELFVRAGAHSPCRISPGFSESGAACFPWPNRFVVRSLGCTATRAASVAMPARSTSLAIPLAVISQGWC